MSFNISNKSIPIFLFLSLVFHSLIFIKNNEFIPNYENPTYNIPKIRIVGEETGKNQKLLYVKNEKKKNKKKISSFKDLSFKQLPIQPTKNKKKLINKLPISRENINEFLKTTPSNHVSAKQALQTLNDPINDVEIELEVPKGIKEDQLNKHELVFYSFQKRTVLAYINSFHKELNDFERKNPHLRFPLTKSKQKLAGRVVYDKNGDILRIESLKWTDINKLQSFFMHVLKNMNSLPNPPKEILEDNKFAINFVLSLNN